jgi:hypothetical protein
MVKVIELVRNSDGVTGRPIRIASFKSWRSAWNYFEDDLLYDRRCSCVKIQNYGRNDGTIQHWGWKNEDPECKCRDLVDERLGPI